MRRIALLVFVGLIAAAVAFAAPSPTGSEWVFPSLKSTTTYKAKVKHGKGKLKTSLEWVDLLIVDGTHWEVELDDGETLRGTYTFKPMKKRPDCGRMTLTLNSQSQSALRERYETDLEDYFGYDMDIDTFDMTLADVRIKPKKNGFAVAIARLRVKMAGFVDIDGKIVKASASGFVRGTSEAGRY